MKWEYLIKKIDDDDTIDLNDFGEEGWELVKIMKERYYISGNRIDSLQYIFKRQIKIKTLIERIINFFNEFYQSFR